MPAEEEVKVLQAALSAKKPDVVRLAESASKAFEAFFSEPKAEVKKVTPEENSNNKTDDSESSGETNV